jgi:hypothetical protein
MHIVRTVGSNNFSLSYGGSKRGGGGFEIACVHFSSEMADLRDLKLCGMLHCHLEMCIEGSNYYPMSHGQCLKLAIQLAGHTGLVTCKIC